MQKNALIPALCIGWLSLTAAPLVAQPVPVQLEDPKSADVQVVGHVLEPEQLTPTPERLARLSVPDGFEVTVFARDLINSRMIAVAGDGKVYVTRRSVGDVVMLSDANGDGMADGEPLVVATRPGLHGIAIDGTTIYLATVNDLYRAQIRSNGTLTDLDRLIDDLPDGGQHPNRTMAIGPDGRIYLSVGSTCNACGESSPESAAMLRVEPDGSSRTIFASGLRNTIGFGFEPESGELYGMDHGIDWLGDNEQHEELNHLVEGNTYGWPFIYADGKYNPQDYPPNGLTIEEWAEQSTEPVGLYTPHAAPMQMAFYTGTQFPQAYRGDAFIAMRGSWNRKPPSGYEVLRIRFENGRPAGFEPFITGFLMEDGGGWGHMGRLAGLAQARDGSLLLSDDTNGVIYRIAYTGGSRSSSSGAPGSPTNVEGADVGLTGASEAGPPVPTPPQLAIALTVGNAASLEVDSPAFDNGERLPDVYAAEGQNISPPLSWDAGPAGTMSYALIMEDPDVAQEPPFVHWILYNVPPDVTMLEEGIPPTPKLVKPEGALQGANDRGAVGYFGPRPPTGDPAHHYHFEVFALDAMLDLPHGAGRAAFLKAIEGHVLARGEVVGLYQR